MTQLMQLNLLDNYAEKYLPLASTIEMKGITRSKLTIISESAICKKFLVQIWSYVVSLL
jgi:hypothetical protein